ncbi:lamin tail domain-containing protein [Bacillus litorisediminis]|uniref:lamin tail domain-containing protein n=1 Tax=Bacillus litorisediminis TaxID=2922713 RepID=UPI001FAFFF11|nr:lamin tail domain-containing protein [Bacillus litorisediminis]
MRGKRMRNKFKKGMKILFILAILFSNGGFASNSRLAYAENQPSSTGSNTPAQPEEETTTNQNSVGTTTLEEKAPNASQSTNNDSGPKDGENSENKIVTEEDNGSPVIQHTPVTEVKASEDVVIAAEITNATEFKATLHYQASPDEVFHTIPMNLVDGSSYQAVIPKEQIKIDSLKYYITISQSDHEIIYPEGDPFEVSVSHEASIQENGVQEDGVDFNSLPHLLVTELSPNSSGSGTDYYEYFELYNNTNQPLDLTNYSFIYRYTDTGNELSFQIPVTTIEPQETLVFWFNNGDRTHADFNTNFGTALSEEQVIQFKDVFPGFANGGNRAIVIKDPSGAEVISASYLSGETDNAGAVVEYKYPTTGTEMVKHQVLTPPTPGTIEAIQVPETPVTLPDLPEDVEAPVITHGPITSSEPLTSIQIEATVTDNLAVRAVTLYYKKESDADFTSIPMSPNDQTYTGEIPSFQVYEPIVYYIQASDGVNFTSTNEYTIQVVQPEVDYTSIPYLLVTELVPDTTNVGSADGYEFIEIYNNSNQAINFKDYKMYYRYGTDPGTDVVWPSVPEEVVIPAGETLVLWIINTQNREQTVADFNANYGTSLVENEDIVRIYSDGMANGSMRGLVVGTNTHKEISVSYYNDEPNVDDTYANKGIIFGYPTDKSTVGKKIGVLDATPGRVEGFQVPSEPVHLEADTVPPTIENLTNLTEVNQKDNIDITANVTDDQEVKSVRLFYKVDNQSTYKEAILQENYDDLLYHHTIYSPDLIGNQYVEYYFVVSDGSTEVKSDTYRVTITNDLDSSSLRLNVKSDEILRGEKELKATSATDAPADIKMFIDGKEVTDGLYQSVEHTAYFAFEVNGLNTYFQNAVTMGEEVLYLMDDDWLTQWKTFSIPIEPERLAVGETVITVRSGNKASPFDLDSAENRDDYDLKNVRLVLADGTIIRDPAYSDPSRILKMNDANPFVDFTFTITEKEAHSKTYKWDTASVSDGKHVVMVQDKDEEVSTELVVDNTAPTVKTSLKNGKEYKGAFSIDVDVKDKLSGVESYKVMLDGKDIQVPLETSSAELTPGEHELLITAFDKAGNQQETRVQFSVADENPSEPEVVSPANNSKVDGDPKLQVKVTDPTNDKLDVTFYKGYKYDLSTDVHVKGFKHATEFEPPLEMVPEGEQAFTSGDIQLVSKADGSYLTSDSETQFPYHRFDVTVDESLDENDRVELYWKGNSLEGRKVSMYAWNHSSNQWTLIDYKIAGTEDFQLKGLVTVGDYVKDSKINVLVQDEIPSTPDDYDYTFVWMSDTQFYSESFPYIYERQTEWIAEKREELKIKYVFHTGDLVNKSNQEYQWKNADTFMKVLDDHQIPYGVLAGNHDVDQVSNDYTEYYKYFGEDRFKDKPYYGGSYLNNRGHYDLISVDGNDFIMVYLGWGVTDEGIQWVNEVLAAHPDRMAILNFHEYLLATGSRHPLGEKLYNEIVLPNPNVIAVLSGHYHEAQTLVDEIDDDGDGVADRQVTQMLVDYQAGPEGGQGYMRLLHFDQDNNRVLVNTYSPYLDDYNFYDPETYPGKDEFVMNLDLAPTQKRVATDYFAVNIYTDHVIDTDNKVNSGDIAEAVWNGLESNKAYSWYVIVEDKYTGRMISDIWTFVKGEENEGTDNKQKIGSSDSE